MAKRFLSLIAQLCERWKYSFAFGAGLGLIGTSFWSHSWAWSLFLGIVIIPMIVAVKYLEQQRKIPEYSSWLFGTGIVCGASVFAIFVIFALYYGLNIAP